MLIILNSTNRSENQKVNIVEHKLRIIHGERFNVRKLAKLGENYTSKVDVNSEPRRKNEFVKIAN